MTGWRFCIGVGLAQPPATARVCNHRDYRRTGIWVCVSRPHAGDAHYYRKASQ